MTWFRSQRRRFAALSALILVLQTLAVAVASHARASSAAADGIGLVPICTANGVVMIDMTSPDDGGSAPSGELQCPLCIVGCATCAAPVLPLLVTTVAMLLGPAPQASVAYLADPSSRLTPQTLRVSSPRGPPALA